MARHAALILLAFLLGSACASDAPEPPRTVLLGGASGTVVLLPMNATTPLPERLGPWSDPVWRGIRGYLQDREYALKTVGVEPARAMWLQSIQEAREASPRGGFDEAAARFAAKLGQHAEFDALISPTLYMQGAQVSGLVASWDGVEQRVEIEENEWAGYFSEETPFEGVIPAASLHVAVIEADGDVVHEVRTGIALLDRIRVMGRPKTGIPVFEVVPRVDPLEAGRLDAALGRALGPFSGPAPGPGDPPESAPQP